MSFKRADKNKPKLPPLDMVKRCEDKMWLRIERGETVTLDPRAYATFARTMGELRHEIERLNDIQLVDVMFFPEGDSDD